MIPATTDQPCSTFSQKSAVLFLNIVMPRGVNPSRDDGTGSGIASAGVNGVELVPSGSVRC